jgi:hypothetical protein
VKGIPLADLRALGRHGRRTRLVAAVLAAAVVAATVAALLASLHAGRVSRSTLPLARSTVVLLDVSYSVEPGEFPLVGREFRALAASGRTVGFAVFSDQTYEVLPPGTPAADLTPYIRFVEAHGGKQPPTPWTQTFTGGTNISGGLAFALHMLRRDHVRNGAVLLISDLANAPNNNVSLGQTVLDYIENGIPLHVVALDPKPQDLARFAGLATTLRVTRPGQTSSPAPRGAGGRFPTALVIIAVLLAALLAVNELALAPVTWRRGSVR